MRHSSPIPPVVSARLAWGRSVRRVLLPLLFLGAPVAAQSQAPPLVEAPSVPLPAELERVLRDYERFWGARNAEGLASLFTADGFVLQPGRQPARGRSAILQAYRGSGGPLALRALAYATADSVGWIIGAYAGRAGDRDIGKFTLLLRRAPGGPWQIAADMDNGNP